MLGAVLLFAWLVATAPGAISPLLLPSPWSVAERLASGLVAEGNLWPYIGVTALESAAGCLVGLAIALPLAVLIYRSRWVSAAVIPFLGATQAIPAIALAPLLVLWIGYGLGAIVTLCVIMVFFPILVSTVVGLRHLDREVVEASLMDGAGSLARLRLIELPLAMPSVLAGVRNGFTLSVTGAVVGEMVMGGDGVGMLLTSQRDRFDTAGMIASIVVLAVMAALVYTFVATIERRWSLTRPNQ
jgi:NitT/TauT family transport system permease protein